jgi:hypothetical protein
LISIVDAQCLDTDLTMDHPPGATETDKAIINAFHMLTQRLDDIDSRLDAIQLRSRSSRLRWRMRSSEKPVTRTRCILITPFSAILSPSRAELTILLAQISEPLL